MHLRAALVIPALSLALLGSTGAARADAVGPEPMFCFPGKVPVSDHSGSRCEDAPPKNCPSGWRGEIGGYCAVARCTRSTSCGDGEMCVEAMVCVEKRTAMDRRHGPGAPPFVYEATLGICGPGVACDPPRQCVKQQVCARVGETPTAYVPPPGQDEPTGLPMRGGGGCGGCAAGNENGAVAAFVFCAALVVSSAARRRRR